MSKRLDLLDRLAWLLSLIRWFTICGLIEAGWGMFAMQDVPELPERPRFVRWRREARAGIQDLADFL